MGFSPKIVKMYLKHNILTSFIKFKKIRKTFLQEKMFLCILMSEFLRLTLTLHSKLGLINIFPKVERT